MPNPRKTMTMTGLVMLCILSMSCCWAGYTDGDPDMKNWNVDMDGRFELSVHNPSPETLPSMTIKRRKGTEFCVSVLVTFPENPGLLFENWCYEGAPPTTFYSARELEGGALEIKHQFKDHPNLLHVAKLIPEPGALEVIGSLETIGEVDVAAISSTYLPDICCQVMLSPIFQSQPAGSRAIPEQAETYYKNFVSRCFTFTDEGLTFLNDTQRTSTAKDGGFAEDDPRDNPPAVQRYYGVWDRVPEGEGTSSLTRITFPVVGVVSSDNEYLVAMTCNHMRFFSQAWLDCFHIFTQWEPADGPLTERTWRKKIYAMKNDPEALKTRIAKDFPGSDKLKDERVPLH